MPLATVLRDPEMVRRNRGEAEMQPEQDLPIGSHLTERTGFLS